MSPPAPPAPPAASAIPALSLLLTRWRIFRNFVCDRRRDSMAKTVVVVVGLTAVVAIGITVSYYSLKFIERFPVIGPQLNAKLLGLLFMVLLTMVAISTAIVTYTSLFLARETGFFFQHPLPPTSIFFFKVFEAVGFSGWATFVLCFPVLVSFGVIRGAGPWYYLEALALLFLFILFCGLLGATISVSLLLVVRKWTARKLVTISLLLLGVVGWTFLRSFDFASFDGENNLRALNRFTMNIAALRSPYFPSTWAESGVLAATNGHHREVFFQGGLLLANCLILLPLLRLYARLCYGGAWLRLSEPRPFWRRREDRGPANGRRGARRALRFDFGEPRSALSAKDFLTLVRSPAQVSQFVMFLILTLVYVLSLTQIPSDMFTRDWRLTLHFANITAICLILSSFTSRFLFPLISLEGRAFWIVGLAPMPRTHLVRQKAVFGLYLILGLGVVATLCSGWSLGLETDYLLSALYVVILAGFVLTCLAVGLGAAYPNLNEDNPARIAVGLGGTLNFFTSALAVAVIISVEAAPYIIADARQPTLAMRATSHALAFAVAAAVSFGVLRVGERALQARDF